MDTTIARGGLREIEEVEPALRAALGARYHGMSITPKRATLYLADDAGDEGRILAAQTYAAAVAAIDPTQPPPSVRREMKREAARTAVRALDFDGLRQRTAAANSVPALRAEVEALTRLVWQLAVMNGLTDSEMGE